jgi:ribosomal protein S18 acetylase RimI-like enzyme
MTGHPLDNVVYASLTGPHARFAEGRGNVLRYPVDVTPILGLPDEPTVTDWADLAELVGPGEVVPLAGVTTPPPEGWEVAMTIGGVQMIDDGIAATSSDQAIVLQTADVPEMLALIDRTKPGPFLPRTIELGTYLGIRRGGELVAMAGERLHPPGFTEISAVCTDEAYRGQGLATELVLAVAAGIRDRSEVPFLHAAATNTNAIRLYRSLGFAIRHETAFIAVRIPVPERVS